MSNLNAIAETNEQKRFVPVNRKPKDDLNNINKIDFEGVMEAWKPATNILARVKERNDPSKPLIVKITPELALDLLTLNDMNRNRDIDRTRIKDYSQAMREKKWKEKNGDTICISSEFKIIDGQHRLWAIWVSKQTIEYIIVTGLDPDTFAFKDIGKNRSAKDTLKIGGHGHIAGPLGYAIKLILLFERKGLVKQNVSTREVQNFEVNNWQLDEPRMRWMSKAFDLKVKAIWMQANKNFFTPPQWLAVYYILHNLPGRKQHAEEFLDSFASGTDLKKGSPIKVARTYFENEMDQFVKYKRKKTVDKSILSIKIKVLFAAWDLWLSKATVSEIKIDTTNPIIKKPNFQSHQVA